MIALFLLVGFIGARLGSGMSARSTVTALGFKDIGELTMQSAYFCGGGRFLKTGSCGTGTSRSRTESTSSAITVKSAPGLIWRRLTCR